MLVLGHTSHSIDPCSVWAISQLGEMQIKCKLIERTRWNVGWVTCGLSGVWINQVEHNPQLCEI